MKFVPKISRDILRRAGWLALTALFIFTGLGIGVYAFWQAVHQPATTSQSQTTATDCQFSGSIPSSTITQPEAYKPDPVPTTLVATDLTVGSGAVAAPGKCLLVKYIGNLTNGTVFDENYATQTGLQFTLGQGEVIPGWDQGLVGMKVGGQRRLIIPPSLGYGAQAQGSIPANSTLVFTVTLLSIK